MESEIARWRIAYDTVSALVAADQRRTNATERRWSMSQSRTVSDAVAASQVSSAAAASDVTSHRMTQQLQQQHRRGDASVAAAQLTQSSRAVARHTVLHSVQSTPPPPTALPAPPNDFRSVGAAMTSLAGAPCGLVVSDWRRDDAAQLVRDGEALVALFRRLLDTFYVETLLWMYSNVLRHPAARRTCYRLHWLGVVTGRGLEQATSNVLTGFVAGYRQSRQAVIVDVEATLRTTSAERAGRLTGLAVELGVILNPRQMMRAFSAVVRDLVYRMSFHTAALTAAANANSCPPPANGLYRAASLSETSDSLQRAAGVDVELSAVRVCRYEHAERSCRHGQPTHRHYQATCYASILQQQQRVASSTRRRQHHTSSVDTAGRYFPQFPPPPPPPPYPGFLLHFLSVLEDPPAVGLSQTSRTPGSSAGVTISDNPSYEELLRLGDAIGEVRERGLKLDVVQHLPCYVHVVPDNIEQHSVLVCVICLDQFTTGQMIRALPCCHEYHAHCVDRWLTINRTCPVCRYDINPDSIQPTTSV